MTAPLLGKVFIVHMKEGTARVIWKSSEQREGVDCTWPAAWTWPGVGVGEQERTLETVR